MVSFRNKRYLVLLGIGAVATLSLAPVEPGKDFVKSLPGSMELQAFIHNSLNRPVTPEEAGNGLPASEIVLQDPAGVAQDPAGNVYISDRGGLVWRIDAAGKAQVIAGTGRRGRAREGQPAIETDLGVPQGIAFDSKGRLHIADSWNNVVLRIDSDGAITRIAGTGIVGNRGDGGKAIDASLDEPYDIRFDSDDNLFIVEFGNNWIRKVDGQGRISVVAGTGEPGYSGDSGPATSALLNGPYGAFIDHEDCLYIADSGNNALRKIDANGIINTIAGGKGRGYAGDGGQATDALLDSPQFLVVEEDGRILVGDEHNLAIRAIASAGTISTLIGSGAEDYSDGDDPTIANMRKFVLDDPEALLLQSDGSLLIVDGGTARVIRLLADGAIEHYAGRSLVEPVAQAK